MERRGIPEIMQGNEDTSRCLGRGVEACRGGNPAEAGRWMRVINPRPMEV